MPVRCMEFLGRKRDKETLPVYVAFGDEEFLRRQAHLRVRKQILGDEFDDFTYAVHAGETATLADVVDDLRTAPFLGDQKLVVVEQAEKFVTEYRDKLLGYVQKPSSSGILFLEVQSWRSNTKLYKEIEICGLAIDCASLKTQFVPDWCIRWSRDAYQTTLERDAASWLVELVGPVLGILDQEIAKLATYGAETKTIDSDSVRMLVAGTRTENVFKLLDMALEGQVERAMDFLDRQIIQGEQPVAILAMMTSQLRKLTRAARDRVAGKPMHDALRDAGVLPFVINKAADQLRRLGRERMAGMYRLLLQSDLNLKGGSSFTPRFVVERLLLQLAR